MAGSFEKTPLAVRRKICELYIQGFSFTAVGRTLGVGQSTVAKTLETFGIPTRTRGEGFKLFRERNPRATSFRETEERKISARKAIDL